MVKIFLDAVFGSEPFGYTTPRELSDEEAETVSAVLEKVNADFGGTNDLTWLVAGSPDELKAAYEALIEAGIPWPLEGGDALEYPILTPQEWAKARAEEARDDEQGHESARN